MSKVFKIIAIIFGGIFILVFIFALSIFVSVSGVEIDRKQLKANSQVIVYLDNNSKEILSEVNGNNFTSINKIPAHVQNAFISVEDKRFYQHKGIDTKGLFRAAIKNIKHFAIKEGGSTITQQLIKNTQLSNEKTLKRKFTEIKLAKRLEKEYTKKEILEMYLNTIYFGDGNYGITSASLYYFKKQPEELSINEGACLAGIVKSPLHYSPLRNIDNANKRKNIILGLMKEQKLISKKVYQEYSSKDIILAEEINKDDIFNPYFREVKKQLNEIIETKQNYCKKLYVKTYYNEDMQELLTNERDQIVNSSKDYSSVLIDKCGKINAYYSSCGNLARQAGSVLKPFFVYAPAIEMGAIDACTIINDEQVSFSGYKPKNYNNKYYGKISAREALSVSSNVCAVKLLNQIGIENSLKYASKTDIKLNKEDKSLTLALGSLYNGVNLINLTATYSVFNNKGIYSKPSFIQEIYNEHGQTIYKDNNCKNKIFSDDTSSILNDMLDYTVQNGTCKKLKSLNFPIYAKSGTVGTTNGNTDAYTISYTDNLILGVWVGNSDNTLMDNSVTGGGLPCSISKEIFSELYSNAKPSSIPKYHKEVEIDKILYEKNGSVLLAENIAPERYKLKEIFKNNRVPKNTSETFSSPNIEILNSYLDYNGYNIQLCQTECLNYLVLKENNNKKKIIFDSKNKKINNFLDANLLPNTIYKFSIIPYYEYKNKVYYGKEIYLQEIKTPILNGRDDWWID